MQKLCVLCGELNRYRGFRVADQMIHHSGNSRSRVARLLFPASPRWFPGQRWLNISLRSIHIIGVAGIGGGFLFGLQEAQWMPFWHLTLATGVILSLLYIWSDAIWLFQLKGLAIVFKVLLLGAATTLPAWRAELFMLIILISGLIAHAPGWVRGYQLVMRKNENA